MKKLIVAVAALALMAGSAYAAEWNFYGYAQVFTVWSETDTIDGDDGDWIYEEGLYDGACIGAEVKVSDELSAVFEYDSTGGTATISYLYGEWNFGPGSLTVGVADNPINITYSNQLVAGGTYQDLNLNGYGDFDSSDPAEVMLTFGGFKVAIVAPNDYFGNAEVVIPSIQVAYTLGFDMGEVAIAGGYATYEVNDEDIDGYGIGAGTNLNFGPVGVFATVMYGQNVAMINAETASGLAGRGTTAEDCDSLGFTIGAKFTINEMFAVEAGYGYIKDELGDVDDKGQSYYIQAPVTVAPGVTITPEVGMIDEMDSTQEETLYFGACWEIAF